LSLNSTKIIKQNQELRFDYGMPGLPGGQRYVTHYIL